MRCPECGEEVDHLTNVVKDTVEVFRFDPEREVAYEFEDRYVGNTSHFECPRCGAILAREEKEAVELLRKPELERKTEQVLKEKEGGDSG